MIDTRLVLPRERARAHQPQKERKMGTVVGGERQQRRKTPPLTEVSPYGKERGISTGKGAGMTCRWKGGVAMCRVTAACGAEASSERA